MQSSPETLLRYRVLGTLGAGTSGEVLLAEDTSNGEQVAIKRGRRGSANASPGLGEAGAVLSLRHPGLVRCLDFFYLADGGTCVVYELMRGGSLRDHLAANPGPLRPAWALEIVARLLDGLAYLHARDLVHGDVKPENLFFATADDRERGIPKLGDFSACSAPDRDGKRARVVPGTPAYLAPERFYEASGTASDLYSVGILLYELLVGDRPHHGSATELARAHLHEAPDLSRVPEPWLVPILEGLLAKDPRRRLGPAPAARAFLEQLRQRRTPSPWPMPGKASEPPPAAPARPKVVPLAPVAEWKPGPSTRAARPVDALAFAGPPSATVLMIVSDAHVEFRGVHDFAAPSFFLARPTAMPVVLADGSILAPGSSGISLWSPGRPEPVRLATTSGVVRVVAADAAHRRLAWADDTSISVRDDPSGPVRSERRTRLGTVPRFLFLDNGETWVGDGLFRARIRRFGATQGDASAALEPGGFLLDQSTQGPPWFQLAAPEDGEGVLVHVIDGEGRLASTRLPATPAAHAFRAGHLLVVDDDGVLHEMDATLDRRTLGPLPCLPSAIAASHDGRWVALAHDGNPPLIELHRLPS